MKLRTIIFAGTAALLLTNCGEKKKSDVIIVEKYEEPAPSGPIKMEAYSDSKSITWLGEKKRAQWPKIPATVFMRAMVRL